MKKALRFVWRTFVAGALFIVPLAIVIVLAVHAVGLVARVLTPVAAHLPIQPAFGMNAPQIAAVLVLLSIGFLAGLLAQTVIGARVRATAERLVLSKVPGFTLVKSMAEGAMGGHSDLKVALANIDDAWLMSFIVEEHKSGLLTVFVPSAPTPTAGSIYYLTEKQVKRLDVPVSAAIKCIMQLGVGSRELLEGAGSHSATTKPD